MPSSFPIKCGGRQHCLRRLFGFWGIKHYPLKIKRLPGPVTEQGGYQRPLSMAINTTATLDYFGLLDRPFQLYRNIAGEEISGFERKAFTRLNFPDSIVFGFKDPTLVSGFKISGGMSKPRWFYFGFVLLCSLKRQNQSGTETFRIHHESGTISSSVNLVKDKKCLRSMQERWKMRMLAQTVGQYKVTAIIFSLTYAFVSLRLS